MVSATARMSVLKKKASTPWTRTWRRILRDVTVTSVVPNARLKYRNSVT